MDLPPVPASVTALVTSGRLPPGLAALFTSAGEPAVHWGRIAAAVEEYLTGVVDDDMRGTVALAGAYGHLEAMAFLGSEEMTEHNERAETLLREAEERGVEDDETDNLWAYSHRMRDVAVGAAEMERYIAKHGASPRQRLNAKLEQAHALYEAGDRSASLPLFREVAEADLWGEYNGTMDRADVGWCWLLHDAAHVEGPEVARRIWREARASRHAALFPWPGWSCRLVEMLTGTGVPDILEVLVDERLNAALEERPDGRSPWPLDEDERWVLNRALDEIKQYYQA